MKKKVTVLTVSARLFALSAVHSAVCLLGAVLLALSFPAAAQPSRTVRIGYLGNNESRSGLSAEGKDFLEELRRRGWIEGQNLVVEQRYWENRVDRLVAQAGELVSLKVDVIVTSTGTAALAAKRATPAIPIVMVSSADAVAQGLVVSLARPGGNVTGLTTVSPWVAGKRLELLKEAFPGVSRVALLTCPSGRGLSDPSVGKNYWNQAQEPALVRRIQLIRVAVSSAEEVDGALGVVTRKRADGLFVYDCSRVPDAKYIELAAKSRRPAIYPYSRFPKRGGLMSYGANGKESYRRAAHFVDKILKGANPADLPVEQPTKFELVINLKTARQIGVTIPPEVLMWANEVIK